MTNLRIKKKNKSKRGQFCSVIWKNEYKILYLRPNKTNMLLSEIYKNNDIKTVSLFSGAGGLDIGAIKAGAKIIWANDMMKEACLSYATNIGDHIVRGNIDDLIEDLSELSDVDLVIGGPPCQGFSVAGKMDEADQRSQLVWSYADVISTVLPKAFIMENVKALGELEKWKGVRTRLMERFRGLGYSVNLIVVNASDFNVPQSRERVFVIGFKGDRTLVPNLELMIEPYKQKAPTVRQALKVLDRAGEGNNRDTCNAKITLAANPVLRKSAYAGMLFNGLGRPTRLDGYCATLPASMGGNKTPIIDEKELYEGKDPWVVSYHERIMKDPSSAEFKPAPDFLRRMTVAEAAILQTFPIDYHFCGSQSSKFTQIGNAVPCNLGFAIASMVIDVLQGKRDIVYSDAKNLQYSIDFNMESETSMGRENYPNREKAKTIALNALNEAELSEDALCKSVYDYLKLEENHIKIYKYILVGALLAKATDSTIDPMSLQKKKGDHEGAYNARTFCSEVVCKFLERTQLPNCLGNSNDPLVGNPGRNPNIQTLIEIGKSRNLARLKDLASILQQIDSSDKAYACLKSAMVALKELHQIYEEKLTFKDSSALENKDSVQYVLDFIWELSEDVCNGETCPLIVSTLEQLSIDPTLFDVVPHKVNESGESSKEVEDIDIISKQSNRVVCAIEIKDKPFTVVDVADVMKKCKEADVRFSYFIYGKNVNIEASKSDIFQFVARWGRLGYYCCVINVVDYAKMKLIHLGNINLSVFISTLLNNARVINARDTTLNWINKIINEFVK